jgi:hypothetical protein
MPAQFDLLHNALLSVATASGTYKSAANPTSAIIDTKDYEGGVLFIISAGSITDAQTFTLVEGDDSNLNDGVTLTAADAYKVIGQANPASMTLATTDANTVVNFVLYKGEKRYVKLASTAAGATGATYQILTLRYVPRDVYPTQWTNGL